MVQKRSICLKFIFLCIVSYNKSTSKSRFSKGMPNYADELLIASLQISEYRLAGSEVILR